VCSVPPCPFSHTPRPRPLTVRVVDPAQGLSVADEAGASGSSVLRGQNCCDFFKVIKFYEEGNDSINEHKVALEQWKPTWSSPADKKGETRSEKE